MRKFESGDKFGDYGALTLCLASGIAATCTTCSGKLLPAAL